MEPRLLLKRARACLGLPRTARDRGAEIALYTGWALARREGVQITPAVILQGLIVDPEVDQALNPSSAVRSAVVRACSDAPALSVWAEWSRKARGVFNTAKSRATQRNARRVMLTRGDLLSALAGESTTVGHIVRKSGIDFAEFDRDIARLDLLEMREATEEDPPPMVVAFDDARTTMDFVSRVMRENFACSHAEAFGLMYRVHINDAAVVTTALDFGAARDAVERTTRLARSEGYPLELKMLTPRAA